MLFAALWTIGYILLVVISIMMAIVFLFIGFWALTLGLLWLLEVIANFMR